jgi:hypothetical protein
MAKNKSMPFEQALQVILSSEGDNPFRQMLEIAVQGALECEMSEHLGAKPYERTEDRKGYRNGNRVRILTTAVGDLNLLVPQDREGIFQTTLFERYKRSDKAFVLALMEMYVKGVSTRKVADITEKCPTRVDSPFLLPKGSRCLIGLLPSDPEEAWYEEGDKQAVEAGADRCHPGAIQKSVQTGESQDPGRVRFPDRISPKARDPRAGLNRRTICNGAPAGRQSHL